MDSIQLNKDLLPEPPKTAKVDPSLNDPVWRRVQYFTSISQVKISEQITDWLRADQMYRDGFNTDDDNVNLYNPTMLVDIVQRMIDALALAEYYLRIPQSEPVERQIVKDALMQVEQESGLFSEIRDDDKGALSWTLLGNLAMWWGKADKHMIAKGCPLQFKTLRLSQVYFDTTFANIRESNGKPLHNELFIVMEFPYGDVLDMFDYKYDTKTNTAKYVGKNRAATKNTFNWGPLPMVTNQSGLQDVANKDQDVMQYMTQVGFYYNISQGIHEIRVGYEATIVEEYRDNEADCPDYPFKLDGENYLPVTLLKCFPTLGDLYAKGAYHRFAKIARNDARRRSKAHRYVDANIDPDKFIKMNQDRYAQFMLDLDMARQIRNEGDDAYIQLRPDEQVVPGDMRTAPLSQEFERMNTDDQQSILQGGIALQDVQYQNQTATTTLAVEKNKSRLTNHIIKINAGEAAFLRRVMIQFIKDYIKSDNDAPVVTNASAESLEVDQQVAQQASMMSETGMPDAMVKQYMKKNARPTGQEKKVEGVTMGMVADYLREKEVYIQTDYSAWNEVEYEMRLKEKAMGWAQGTPMQIEIQKDALALLGYDAFKQDLMQQPGIGEPQIQQQQGAGNLPQGASQQPSNLPASPQMNNVQAALGGAPQEGAF